MTRVAAAREFDRLCAERMLVVSVMRAAAAAMKSQTIRTLCTNRDRDRKDF